MWHWTSAHFPAVRGGQLAASAVLPGRPVAPPRTDPAYPTHPDLA
jgi:hypothetical protein